MRQGPPKTFIVPLWSGVFQALSYVSPFALIGLLVPRARASYAFVDCWVLGHTLCAAVVLLVTTWRHDQPITWLFIVVMAYGYVRVFEIVVYQTNAILFSQYRTERAGGTYRLRGYRRIVLLLLHNYFEVILWFAVGYVFTARANLVELGDGTLFSVLRSSLLVMVTLSADNVRPVPPLGLLELLTESGIGVFMTILVLARFVSLLPTPATMDEYEAGPHRKGTMDRAEG